MASRLEFVEYVVEQLSEAGTIRWKRMFGEFGLYCDGIYFACVCDDRLLVKQTDAGRALLPAGKTDLPYPGAKPMLLIEELDDRAFLARLARATCAELPPPKARKK